MLVTEEEPSGFPVETTEYTVDRVEVKPKPVYAVIKRIFDIFVSLLAGIILLIPMGIIAIAIKLDSKGSVLYRQERLGLNGKQFTIFKFRSMRMDAEENGPQWAELVDDRCTSVGRFLRKCRLTSFPSFGIFSGVT